MRYTTKARMLTYWYQIKEILQRSPSTVLEVGVGPGLVKSYLEHLGILVETLDVNPALNPDYVDSLLNIQNGPIKDKKYDLVLCSRVLHHIGFNKFELALQNLDHVTGTYLIVTLPVNDLRFYTLLRLTSTDIYTVSLPIPFKKKLKEIFKKQGSGIWQVNSNTETAEKLIVNKVKKFFVIETIYQIPEDSSHLLMVLKKKTIR